MSDSHIKVGKITWCDELFLTVNMKSFLSDTYNILIAKFSELGQLLGHQEFCHSDDSKDCIFHIFRDIGSAVQIFFEITDILFKLEYFILKHLEQLTINSQTSCQNRPDGKERLMAEDKN